MEYEDLVQSDLDLMYILQDWFVRNPLVSRGLHQLTSKYPWKDICNPGWTLIYSTHSPSQAWLFGSLAYVVVS